MDLHPTPENPAPPDALCVKLTTPDGMTLRAMRAGGVGPRGTVVVLGGRGDFMERYFETMRDLIAMGFSVASVDLRGQGGSERPFANPYRNHIGSFARYEADIETLMNGLVLKHCPPPYYIIGHSTGGNVVLRVLRRHFWFKRAVVCSPLLGLLYGPWPRPVAAALVGLANVLGLGWLFLPGQLRKPMGRADFDRNPLTSDRWRWHRDSGTLEAAPHLGLGGPTFGWLRAARRSIASLQRMGKRKTFNAPVLIVAAGFDQVVDNEATRRLARRHQGVALCFVPAAKHEVLSEADIYRRQFLAAFESFVSSA